MNWRGDFYNNAYAESFWSRCKAELLGGDSFPGLTGSRLEISPHIAYHNAEQRHSLLGNRALNHLKTCLQTASQFCPA